MERSKLVDLQTVKLEVLRVLDAALSTQGRALRMPLDAPLLGAVPELDSMAIVAVITGLQDQLGVMFHDEDFDGDSFQTVGHLVHLVQRRLALS